jgi:hypothetical protein
MTLPAVTLGPQTDLDAVNEMMMSIGQAPVSSIATVGIRDLAIAVYTLGFVSRQVQSRGWWFNREIHFLMTQDVNQKYPIPANALSVRFYDQLRNGGIQNGFLYDMDNHSFTFPNDPTLYVDIIYMYDYNTLPQEARNYIGVRACRIFQAKVIGSETMYKSNSDEEVEAMAAMKREHLRNSRNNMFFTSTGVNRIYTRNY